MTSAEMTSNIAIIYICMSNMNMMPCQKKLCITLTACGLLTFNMSKMNAQTHCVVADMETRIPIRNVKVFTNRGDVYVTDYTGQLHVDKPFESATLGGRSGHLRFLRDVPQEALQQESPQEERRVAEELGHPLRQSGRKEGHHSHGHPARHTPIVERCQRRCFTRRSQS